MAWTKSMRPGFLSISTCFLSSRTVCNIRTHLESSTPKHSNLLMQISGLTRSPSKLRFSSVAASHSHSLQDCPRLQRSPLPRTWILPSPDRVACRPVFLRLPPLNTRSYNTSNQAWLANGSFGNGQSERSNLGEVPLNLGVGLIPPQPLEDRAETQAYARELHTVTVAICANVVIFAAKLITFLFSGSSTMLAETVHSVVDTFNQVLLRVGIVRSRKAPTTRHPYGYLKDKFVWSLVSAVGIFCLGAGITTAHGFSSLLAGPQALENLGYGMTVLALSFFVEGYSLLVATRAVVQGAQAAGLSFWEYLRRGMDPTSIAVMMEDGAAVAGLLIAGGSTAISHATGNSMYDAVGSIAIGILLGCTALFLISQNRSLLIGRSMQDSDMLKIMALLRQDSIVKAVHDAKSEEIGPGIYRFKAEIEFKGDRLVQRHLDRLGGVERLHEQIYSAVITKKRESLDMALVGYGNDMIGALGAEIDRLENEIRALVPGVRHIDLETDRGRRDVNTPLSNGLYSVDAEPQR